MAWSRTCRPVPPVAANIVSLIRRSILDRCLPTGGLRVHAFAAGLAGKTVSGHRAIVVEPEEGDHLANIGVVLDGAGLPALANRGTPGEERFDPVPSAP